MQACDELFRIDDALRLNLVDVSLEHCLKSGTKCLLWELKIGQDLFHLRDCDASTALRIRILQCIVEFHLLKVHLRDVDLVEEQFVLDYAAILWVQLFDYHFELAR